MKSSTRINNLNRLAINGRFIAGIGARKPLLLARLLKNYARVVMHPGKPPIRLADIAVTYSCNMTCVHCSAKGLEKMGAAPLSPGQYRTIARKLLDAGLLVANFTGGEPLLNKDLAQIIGCFAPEKTLISLSTNGALLTRDKLKELREARVDCINISLDAAKPEEHDAIRGYPGGYEKALAAAREALSMGFRVNICYVLTNHNIHSHDREEISRKTRLMGANLHYNLAVPIGAWNGRHDGLITPQDRKDINRIMKLAPHSCTDQEVNYFRKGCGAIKEKLYVTLYGEVMPCPFIQVSFGNLLTQSVREIRKTAFAYQCFREYKPLCIAAEDREFIANTRCYQSQEEKTPLPVFHTQAFRDRERMLAPMTKKRKQ